MTELPVRDSITDMGQQLDQFQLDTLAFLDHAGGRAVVADPMGARKTGTILSWLERANVLNALIVAPSSVHMHWIREASKFHPYAGQYHGAGSKDKRIAAMERAIETAELDHLPALYVTTYESMKIDQFNLRKANFDCVVFDEGHKLKGRRTQGDLGFE